MAVLPFRADGVVPGRLLEQAHVGQVRAPDVAGDVQHLPEQFRGPEPVPGQVAGFFRGPVVDPDDGFDQTGHGRLPTSVGPTRKMAFFSR